VLQRLFRQANLLFVSPKTGTRLLLLVLLALVLRLAVMAFLYDEQLNPERDHWRFGYETGRIARSIAEGKGYGNPLFGDTGPTAWMPPVYPYLIAAVFKVFGIYTTASAIVILSLQALLSALTCVPIYFIARKSFGDRAGLWAGWGWAFFPYGIYFPVERIWPTWLATLLLSLLFLIALQLENSAGVWAWTGFGLLWGVTALTEPAVLSVLPALALWGCYRLYKSARCSDAQIAARIAASAIAFLLVVSPWFIRNYGTFHQLVPFRDNLGLELCVGNNGETWQWATYELGPWHSDAEWGEYQRGELSYMAHKRQQALEFIGQHPGWFARATVRRMVYIWTGFWSFDRRYLAEEPFDIPNIFLCTGLTALALIGLRRAFKHNLAMALPYAFVLIFFPLVYYVTHPEVYYRRPIDPILVVLAAYAMSRRRFAEDQPSEIVAATMESDAMAAPATK